jgi:hypothetical protein
LAGVKEVKKVSFDQIAQLDGVDTTQLFLKYIASRKNSTY